METVLLRAGGEVGAEQERVAGLEVGRGGGGGSGVASAGEKLPMLEPM